jgi:MoaA/NifB/PqqE/SkfB family radical SAM enzyme
MLTGGKGCLERVLKNIETLRVAYRPLITLNEGLTVLSLAVNTTVSTKNVGELPQIRASCGEDIYFICNPLDCSGAAMANWDRLMLGVQNPAEFADLIKDYSEAGGPLTLGKDGCCSYSKYGISLSENGDWMTCAYTQRTNGLLGNIRRLPLKDAYMRKHGIESKFYEEKGSVPCFMRAFIGDYVDELKKQNKGSEA